MIARHFTLTVLAASLLVVVPVFALDLGLEAELRLESSDNVGGSNTGAEEDGQLGYLLLGVYGEQRGRLLQGGFSGEIETRRLLSDSDSEPSTLSNFYGAANLLLSPAFSWYFGDVLGTVRTGDGILSLDEDENTVRRNVFVTGPSFNFDIDSFSQISAELLYFNQSEDDRDLAQLYNASFDWRQETDGGNTFGISINDIYTDEPEADTGEEVDSDNNRLSASAFWERSRNRLTWFASAGATRYDVNEATINGANAEFRVTRQFTAISDLSFSIGTDLTDENISTINSLLADGEGVEPEAAGVFQQHSASLIYRFGGAQLAFETGVRAADQQYQTLTELGSTVDPTLDDNLTLSAFAVASRRFTPRIAADFELLFENQQYDNIADESDSVVANVSVGFQINPSFEIRVGARTARSEGINTRENVIASSNGEFETIENRALLSLRWAPPSRATKEPVIQLKQLLR